MGFADSKGASRRTPTKSGSPISITPSITPHGAINLKVHPAVSSLDFANAVTLQGFLIPAVVKREAETDLLIQDGHTAVIGGIFTRNTGRNLDQVPVLGDIPILGVALGLTDWMLDARVPDQLADWAAVHVQSRWVFLLGLNIILLFIGGLVEIYAAIVVVVPLLLIASWQAGHGWAGRHTRVLMWGMVLSALFPALGRWIVLTPPSQTAAHYAHVLSGKLRRADIRGPFAGNAFVPRGRTGLYVAFLMEQPWLGDEPNPTAQSYRASGANVIVVRRDAPVNKELEAAQKALSADEDTLKASQESLAAAAASDNATMRGLNLRICSSSFSSLLPAVSPATRNSPGNRSTISSVLVPIDPVDPRITIVFI